MNAFITGILTGTLVITVTVLAKQINKQVYYALTLCGIGFLYVGFTWSDTQAFAINSLQAVAFLSIAYYGVKKNGIVLATGFFLHGGWDLAYGWFSSSSLIPPHYDIFCLTADFTIGAYLLYINLKFSKKNSR